MWFTNAVGLKEIFCTSLTSASFFIVVGFLANGRKSYEKKNEWTCSFQFCKILE